MKIVDLVQYAKGRGYRYVYVDARESVMELERFEKVFEHDETDYVSDLRRCVYAYDDQGFQRVDPVFVFSSTLR